MPGDVPDSSEERELQKLRQKAADAKRKQLEVYRHLALNFEDEHLLQHVRERQERLEMLQAEYDLLTGGGGS